MRRAEQLADIDYEPAPEENKLGHYLQTTNPQAAAEIDNPPTPPDVGTWVVFKDRAGVSRMHRVEFPAFVLGADSEGLLTLMVVMEPEDMKMEDHVPFRSHNAENYYWRHVRNGIGTGLSNNIVTTLAEIESRVETVESVLASDEMEALEKRIAALEGKKKPGRKPKAK